MPRWGMVLAYIRSLILALRIIAFEKSGETVLLLWAGPALMAVAVCFLYSAVCGFTAAGVTLLLYYGARRWALANRFRLIRPGDRIEYANMMQKDEGYRQRFETGVVLKRLTREDVARSGGLDAEQREMSRWFYLVRSGRHTRIVPLEWIVAIEIDENGN